MRSKLPLILCSFFLIALKGFAQEQYFSAGQTSGDVIFTDLNPDVNLNFNSQYLMDIDKDGIDDFKITMTYLDGPAMSETLNIAISGLNKNKVIFSLVDMSKTQPNPNTLCGTHQIAKIFNYGDSILMLNDTCKEADIWFSKLDYNGSCSADDWMGIGAKYIGLVMNHCDSLTYAWLKIDFTDPLIVMEYAASTTDITQNQNLYNESRIKIFPNPIKDFIQIVTPIEMKANHYNLIVMNDIGVKMIDKEIDESNCKLDMSKFAAGTYLVEINDHSKIFFKQMVVKY